tara:strand:- start:226 stop:354 length:129 start_codon:yes stop_codon:yes gene_type:complete
MKFNAAKIDAKSDVIKPGSIYANAFDGINIKIIKVFKIKFKI